MIYHLLHSFDFRFGRASVRKLSVLALLLANLYPVVGVIAFGWDVFLLLVLFWMENLVIGFYTMLKMLFVPHATRVARSSFVAFFCIHYGIFTLAHGIFVFAVFGEFATSSPETATVWDKIVGSQLIWGGLVLLVSHGISFFYNYIGYGEYKQSKLNSVMLQPYGRVVILHLTIIFGGFLMAMLGSPVIGLIFLIVLKTAIDVRSHLREHGKYSVQKPATT